MNYLSMLNNELQSLMVVILFSSIIFLTIAMLCEMISNQKICVDLFVVCRVLTIALNVIWAYIFFNFKNTSSCYILAYYSVLVLGFEIVLMITTKKWIVAIDFPFLVMLLPFWKYISPTLSVVLIIVAVVYLFAKSLFTLLESFSKLKSSINYYSLKEALDGLKTAIMFENKFDVVYENMAMINLLDKLAISKSRGAFELWQNLKSRETSKIIDNQNILVFLEDKVYSFSIANESKIQIYAFDITKEYLTTLEIENKRAELKEKRSEIIKLIDNLDEIERQKQVLMLKSKLHDIIGQRLFILHHVLDAIDQKNFDLGRIKNMLETMLGEIDNDEISEVDALQNSIVTAFGMIGFDIEIVGTMPQEINKSKALVKIIRECATNSIRHAGATKLVVKITDKSIEISDNGKKQKQTIVEGTGIGGMRLNSQALGGKLSVSTDNGFKIIIEL